MRAINILVLGLFVVAFGAKHVYAATLDEILTNPKIWGKDFAAVLANLRSWHEIGEKTVVVFPNRVIGENAYEIREATETAMRKFNGLLKLPPPRTRDPYSKMIRSAPPPDRRFTTAVIQAAEDGSFRVSWGSAQSQMLRDGLTITHVYEALGRPEQISTQIVHSRGEARPLVLTLHSFANGAVVFAESDLSPTPGIVDRVYANVRTVAIRVYGEMK
jgi:hypothetical protein